MRMLRSLASHWAYGPRSGRVRRYFHFLPLSVAHVFFVICLALYVEMAGAFIANPAAIGRASIYRHLDSPEHQLIGAVMLVYLYRLRTSPIWAMLTVVIVACALSLYDAASVRNVRAITVYLGFLTFAVPPLVAQIRGR